MKLHEAYEALQLQPLDDYIFAADDAQTQLGATTLMLVAATLAIRKGLPVMLVMRNIRHGTQSKETLLKYAQQLNTVPGQRAVLPVPGQGNKSTRFTSGGSLLVLTETTMKHSDMDTAYVFRDVEWNLITSARLKEPLERARYLVRTQDPSTTYAVRDSVWDLLFEVTEEGAARILATDPMTIRLDSPPREATPFIDIW